jgi:hypothetical protein
MPGLRSAIAGLFLETPVRSQTLEGMAGRLAESGRSLEQRFVAAPDTPANREQLSHIIGIERWGQSRLQVPLGKPYVRDEYDGYRPPSGATWPELCAAFVEARSATVALAGQLGQAGVSPATYVPHNQIGEISVKSWLQYLNMHANFEGKRVK